MGLLYEDLSYTIHGCIFDVYNTLGTGLDEESYHIFLVERLKELNIPFESKVTGYVRHRGKKVHKFEADIIVANQIILELKHIRTDFIPANFLQILSYLKNWQMDLGILVNFGLTSAATKRVVYTPKKAKLIENYDSIVDLIHIDDKKQLRNLRNSILTILEMHGLGYNESVYLSILKAELSFNNIPFVPEKVIPIRLSEKIVRNYEMKYPIIADKIICGIIAVKEDISLDIARMKTYLKKLNLPYGLLVHFGKKKLEIIGVRP